MRLIILLAALAIALPFIISQVATPFGNAVSERFLERPTHREDPRYTIPLETPTGKTLDVTSLAEWVRDATRSANGYATRVILLDILYLFFLGTFLAIASTTLADIIRWPHMLASLPNWVWWVLPGLYLVSDSIEDCMIFSMLNWPSTIQSGAFDILSAARSVKITTVTLSLVQVVLLSLLSFVFVPSPKP